MYFDIFNVFLIGELYRMITKARGTRRKFLRFFHQHADIVFEREFMGHVGVEMPIGEKNWSPERVIVVIARTCDWLEADAMKPKTVGVGMSTSGLLPSVICVSLYNSIEEFNQDVEKDTAKVAYRFAYIGEWLQEVFKHTFVQEYVRGDITEKEFIDVFNFMFQPEAGMLRHYDERYLEILKSHSD